MAKSTYEVVVIREGRDHDYWNFWKRGKKVNMKGEELDSALLGFTELIEANDKNKAEFIVKQKYPNLTIDSGATNRLG